MVNMLCVSRGCFRKRKEDDVPATFRIDLTDGRATVRLWGLVTSSELDKVIVGLTDHHWFRSRLPVLWDARRADLSSITRTEFQELAVRAGELGLSTEGRRIAVVSPDPAQCRLARMLETAHWMATNRQ